MSSKQSSIITALACGLVLASFGTQAMAAATAQQERMKTCNADAKTKALKGDDRKTFMKSCLSGDAAPPATSTLTPQQEKMKTCNADAKTRALQGDERKAFMKACLAGK
jgi:hypothetical protein